MLLRFTDLYKRKGIPFSRKHIYELERNGEFPKRIPIGRQTVAWDEAEIDAWLEQRRQAREGTEAM